MKFQYCGTGGGCDALVCIEGNIEFLITDGDCQAPMDENKPVDLTITDLSTGLPVLPSTTFPHLEGAKSAALAKLEEIKCAF